MCYDYCPFLVFFFFFQAEDGIRDVAVTGVQTCALPISLAQRLCPGRRCLRPALPVRYFPRFGNRDMGLPRRLLRFAPSLGLGRARARALRARGYLRSALPGRQRRKLVSPAAYQTCYQWPNLLEKLSRPET